VLPKWRGRHYDEITRADVIELLDGLVNAGAPVPANRVQSLISGMYNFAIDVDMTARQPMRPAAQARCRAGRRARA
jgi:hypothetical protein